MDWLNFFFSSALDVLNFSFKFYIGFFTGIGVISYITDLLYIYIIDLTYKPLIVPDLSYWENFIKEPPYIIDQYGEKYFYTDSTSAWTYFDEQSKNYVYNQIYKDLIFRKYLIDKGYETKYLMDILSYYEEYYDKIELYKRACKII